MHDELAVNVRRFRGSMTQTDLAAAAGLSVDVVRQIEQGRYNNPTLNTLSKLAGALDVAVPQLLKEPAAVPTGNPHEGVVAIRRALTPVDDLVGEPVFEEDALTVRGAEQAVTYAWGAYWGGRYDHLSAVLPTTISQLRATLHAVPADDHAPVAELLARAYWVTGCTLVHLGQTDPAWEASRQALTAAQQGNDPLLEATLRGNAAWQLLVQGRYDESRRVSVRAADGIEPQGTPSLPHLSAYGSLVITAATAAGRDQRVLEANHLVDTAREVADRMGQDRHDYETYFGPSQVVMQSVDVAVVTEDYGQALSRAKAMPRENGLPLASRCRHLADKALALTNEGRNQEALDSLLTAEAMGRDWIKHQTLPKRTLAELLERDNSSPLREFAGRLGVRV